MKFAAVVLSKFIFIIIYLFPLNSSHSQFLVLPRLSSPLQWTLTGPTGWRRTRFAWLLMTSSTSYGRLTTTWSWFLPRTTWPVLLSTMSPCPAPWLGLLPQWRWWPTSSVEWVPTVLRATRSSPSPSPTVVRTKEHSVPVFLAISERQIFLSGKQ